MRIDRLYVAGSNTLRNAGISELEIQFPSPISNIRGTNGCGKSLTLSFLDPTPVPTTVFSNWGKREVVYETERGSFTVSTDYSSSTSPHRFIDPDGENLNVGQTARMQDQLCETELGLDAFTIGLMMNKPVLIKRTEGQRKAFLMNIAPTSIGFILDKQKDVEKKIREANANISRLQDRKLQLEQDLLSSDEILSLEEEEQTIHATLEQYQKKLHIIDYEDRAVAGLVEPDTGYVERVRKQLSKESDKARIYTALGVPMETITEEQAVIAGEIAKKKGIVEARAEQIIETRSALSAATERMAALGIKEEILETQRRIADISEIITAKEKIPAPAIMITAEELAYCQTKKRDVEAALSAFLELDSPIMARSDLDRKKNWYRHCLQKNKQILDRIQSIRGEIEDLTTQSKLTTSDIPTPCSLMACPAYKAIFQREDKTEKRVRELVEQELRYSHQSHWCDVYIELAHDVFAVQDDIQSKQKILMDVASGNPVLQSLLRRSDIRVQLKNAPIKLYRDMVAILDQIEWVYEKSRLQTELTELHAVVSRFKAAGDGDVASLEQSIQLEEKRLSDQISGLEKTEREIDRLTVRSNTLSDYKHTLSFLETTEQSIARLREEGKKWVAFRVRQSMRKVLKEKQAALLARIGDIRKTLRDQSLLKARYEEEVLKELDTHTRRREVLLKVCHELTMAPREYMVPFINSILSIVNALIKRYWTQKIEFVLWTVEEDLNYLFPHIKNGNLVKDMDLGSEGERDLFSLLFNLAFRIVRNKTDLPLCLDEVGRTFDETHKQNLVSLLNYVMDQKWATQLIIVSHDHVVHEGFLYSDIIVLNSDNIHVPEVYNEHVTIV